MSEDFDRKEARKVVSELRESARRLIKRSHQLAEESLRLKERADDLDQLIRQRDVRKKNVK